MAKYLKVAKVGHATLLVHTPQVTCFMDPVLMNSIEGVNQLEPKLRIEPKKMPSIDLIVLSHHHMDHFDLDSLNLIDRKAQVIFPEGSSLIKEALARLGFKKTVEVRSQSKQLQFGDLTLYPTKSSVDFPEMGMIFEAYGKTIWNMVDTKVEEKTWSWVRDQFPKIDLLIATYQPLVEFRLFIDSLGTSFPFSTYQRLLSNVLRVQPNWVVPGSCGFKNKSRDWINLRQFPITEPQFLEDVKIGNPKIQTSFFPAGSEITVDARLKVRKNALPFVRNVDQEDFPAYHWNPLAGVPPLEDDNSSKYALKELKSNVANYLKNQFILGFKKSMDFATREKMKRSKCIWELCVVFPDGDKKQFHMDLASPPFDWMKGNGEAPFWKIQTQVASSLILDILNHQTVSYAVSFSDRLRTCYRLYEVTNQGLNAYPSDELGDPLLSVMNQNIDEKWVAHKLRSLGY